MKKAAVGILNRVPVVCIVIGEALVVYTAMAIAKLAFTQLDPLYSVWYRVGFMAVMLLLWRRPGFRWPTSGQGNFLIGLIAILIGGSMWGVYIVTGRRVASGGNSLDNLCIAVAVGWLVQSLFLGVPAVSHMIHPKSDATWALAPGGPWKLLALLFVISLMASFIPYAVEQITLRRTTSGAFSVMQSINPAMAVAVGLAFGEIPDTGEVIGVALVICAVIVTFSGDASLAKGK